MTLLPREFFETSPLECARSLVGCELLHGETAGRIVETEAYDAEDDPACHTFFRPSTRAFVAEMPAGAAYVYLNYGVHWMFNVLVKGERTGFVLVRALEPINGLSLMQERRRTRIPHALCSGPGKLTQALGILGTHHGIDLCGAASPIQLAPRTANPALIADGRIGISRAQDFSWRFTEKSSLHVSRPPARDAVDLSA